MQREISLNFFRYLTCKLVGDAHFVVEIELLMGLRPAHEE
jgi:hypothetical protein